MAYRGFVEQVPESLARTVRGTFDFKGRSTRTEALIYIFVPQILVGIVLIPFTLALPWSTHEDLRGLAEVLRLIIYIPLVALLVRRLHDQDLSGWWVLIYGAALLGGTFGRRGTPALPGIAKYDFPWWLVLILVVGIVATWVLTLWPPTPGTNRFGPNPRLDDLQAEEI